MRLDRRRRQPIPGVPLWVGHYRVGSLISRRLVSGELSVQVEADMRVGRVRLWLWQAACLLVQLFRDLSDPNGPYGCPNLYDDPPVDEEAAQTCPCGHNDNEDDKGDPHAHTAV